ncbi:helix-turn-helix protein [Streptomyces sp. BK208]|nr:helix-turn-helix protein [Streptomyces sp. BK208]
MTGGIDIDSVGSDHGGGNGRDGSYAGGPDGDDLAACEPDREPDPSDSLRTWGAVQQALREHAGYSRAEFADLVRFSKHTVESVELGRRMPDESYVVRSEELLGNTGALRKSSKYVTRGRGDVGLAAWFREWARLERVAVSLCTYECRLVPGLLQSEGYARAVFEGTVPVAPDNQLEDFMARRMERQRMLFLGEGAGQGDALAHSPRQLVRPRRSASSSKSTSSGVGSGARSRCGSCSTMCWSGAHHAT